MNIFKCRHPFSAIAIQKASTREPINDDFNRVTHHLYCMKCGEKLDVAYAEIIGGIDAFLARGEKSVARAGGGVEGK